MGCFVVAEFLLTSALRGPSAIAELLVISCRPLIRREKIDADIEVYIHLRP